MPSNVTHTLQDLRWAYKHVGDEVRGSIGGEKFREMAKEDWPGFVALKDRHEKVRSDRLAALKLKKEKEKVREGSQKAESQVPGTGVAQAGAKDEKTRDIIRVIDEWLKAHGVQDS